MHCYVYKSLKKHDMYLYIAVENDFSNIPEGLMSSFGTPEFVLSFDLDKKDRLGREDPKQIEKNLQQEGYHLQMPEQATPLAPNLTKH